MVDTLSMTMPLVPPDTGAVALAVVPVPILPLATLKFIRHGPPAQPLWLPLPSTLMKSQSVRVLPDPVATSVIGEHEVLALANAGPVTSAPRLLDVIGTWNRVGAELVLPHTYKFPVGVPGVELV
jgi:hypothetical protein